MLQILTGKFFATQNVVVTSQRAVLYANYHLFQPIETVSGNLLGTDTYNDIQVLVYEVAQKMEKSDGNGIGLEAVGVEPIAADFAVVTSFILRITCSPDIDLVRRLSQAQHASLATSNVPSAYVRRFFDQRVNYSHKDPDTLRDFVHSLIGLERETYLRVIRALRRYVTGLHRVTDDLTLAYTLLVASIESLAQDFDHFQPSWQDYEQAKRQSIDKALVGTSEIVADRVRNAILKHEHVALSRRFREFAVAHIQPSFYREEAVNIQNAIPANDLKLCLEQAYRFRSKAVHTLIDLPSIMTLGFWQGDVLFVDGKPALTLMGLARVAHHIIFDFVNKARKIEHEEIDWRSQLPNTITAPVAPQYWIWQHEAYNDKSANHYLSAFLTQLATVLLRQPNASLTDITQVLEAAERQIRSLGTPRQRRPILALYILFHSFSNSVHHRPNAQTLVDQYTNDFHEPSIESMIVQVARGQEIEWAPAQFANIRAKYFTQRYHKQGLLLPPLFEAAITLVLAELYRISGDEKNARQLLAEAVENAPGNRELLEFEQSCTDILHPIQWSIILLPQPLKSSDSATEM